ALAAVAIGEIAAAIDPRHAVLVGAAAAKGIHSPSAFYLDDVGAVVGQQLCRERTRADPGEVSDADPAKKQGLQLMTPDFRRAARAAASYPRPARISEVCSPRRGAGRCCRHGVS